MPRIRYVARQFKPGSQALIDLANEIIDDYQQQGYSLTLRQLYYQFVSRDAIPNTPQSYKLLASVINDARLAGLVDWSAIEDRTRNLVQAANWRSPSEIVRACAEQYRVDRWENQSRRVEVWIEKDALAGVIEPVCNELDVPFFACRGYTSQSEMWSAGQRLLGYKRRVHIIHLGDHDPSGIDMTRDIEERLRLFMGSARSHNLTVHRIALTMEQIRQYDPPPNPAKTTDARFHAYSREFGDESWELDALEPSVLVQLVRMAVRELRSESLWQAAMEREDRHRARLRAVVATIDEEDEEPAPDEDDEDDAAYEEEAIDEEDEDEDDA